MSQPPAGPQTGGASTVAGSRGWEVGGEGREGVVGGAVVDEGVVGAEGL